jgi:hypothetical protein
MSTTATTTDGECTFATNIGAASHAARIEQRHEPCGVRYDRARFGFENTPSADQRENGEAEDD